MDDEQQKPESTPTIVPPIADSNNNGILDGDDLRKQLRREEEQGAIRTPAEPAHGILETAGLREIVDTLNQYTRSTGELPTDAFSQIAEALSNDLAKGSKEYQALASNPAERAKHIQAYTKELQTSGASAEDITLLVADRQSYFDFAATLSKTFPKGVAVDAKDVPEILGHFGPLLIPPPPAAPAPRQQPREPRTIA